MVDVCDHKKWHDQGTMVCATTKLLRASPRSKILAKTEEVHDIADPKMRSAESQEIKRLASEYAKLGKLSEFGSRRSWIPYQLTRAGFCQRSVDF